MLLPVYFHLRNIYLFFLETKYIKYFCYSKIMSCVEKLDNLCFFHTLLILLTIGMVFSVSIGNRSVNCPVS